MPDESTKPLPAQSHADVSASRRGFLQMVGMTGAATSMGLPLAAHSSGPNQSSTTAQASAGDAPPANTVPVTLDVNGKKHRLNLDSRTSLLDALREHVHLTGTKKGCDHGQCGACTVMVNGRRVNSCLSFAVMHEGEEITTIEGLGEPGRLSPMQDAFLQHDGYQCGYCTCGQIVSATALLQEPTGTSDAEVREAMSGNICRCGAYTNIVAAIQQVRNA